VMATCVLCAAANASDPIVGVLLNAGRPVGSTCPVQLSEVKRFGGFLGMLFGGPLGQPVGSLTGETAGIAEGYAKAEAGATDLHGFAIATKLPHETQTAADGSTYSATVYSCVGGAAYVSDILGEPVGTKIRISTQIAGTGAYSPHYHAGGAVSNDLSNETGLSVYHKDILFSGIGFDVQAIVDTFQVPESDLLYSFGN